MQDKQNNSGRTKNGAIQFSDTDELLDIRYDNVFKAVFTKDTPESRKSLSGLVSALIRRKISVDTIKANEPAVNSVFERSIRFEIACKAESGELVNIEMTFNPNVHEPLRLEYYAARQFTGQDIRGADKSFTNLAETFQIAVIGNKRLFPDDVLVHTFQFHDPVHNTALRGKCRIITVELVKAERIIEKPAEQMCTDESWVIFFQYLTNRAKRAKINEIMEREGEIAMAGETLIHISKDEIEFARLTSELKYELDHKSMMVDARREGLAEGIIEGQAEARLEIAKNLKTAGVSAEIIFQTTGINIDKQIDNDIRTRK